VRMAAETLSLEQVWQAVALEERLELVTKAKADGILAAVGFLLLIGSIAYGFDAILLLGLGSIFSILVVPIFSGYSWRRNKPILVLEYLAARTIARKFAQLSRFDDLGLYFIFRGQAKPVFASEEEEALVRQSDRVELDSTDGFRDCWVCLLGGGLVVISESSKGARLEFCGSFSSDLNIRPATTEEDASEGAFVVNQENSNKKTKSLLVRSRYRGALYVFDKRFQHLLKEEQERRLRIEE